LVEFVPAELRQQAAAKGFGSHPGLVRQKKHDAAIHRWILQAWRPDCAR
jgi:hypothetical protein